MDIYSGGRILVQAYDSPVEDYIYISGIKDFFEFRSGPGEMITKLRFYAGYLKFVKSKFDFILMLIITTRFDDFCELHKSYMGEAERRNTLSSDIHRFYMSKSGR